MINKRLHGLHNNEACNLFIKSGNGKFNDWIVTTAFYSALHFVHHHIFPLLIFRRVYRNFDVYYKNEYPNSELPKHTVTRDLVNEYVKAISSKYNWLFKECHNARYRNYIIHDSIAKIATEYLQEIKDKTDE